MAQMKYSKIKITVDSVAGKCPLGNTPGKEFFIERTTPSGMCLSAFNSINPAIQIPARPARLISGVRELESSVEPQIVFQRSPPNSSS